MHDGFFASGEDELQRGAHLNQSQEQEQDGGTHAAGTEATPLKSAAELENVDGYHYCLN